MQSERKTIVKQYLIDRDWQGLLDWAKQNRSAVRTLQTFLVSEDALLRMRAAQGLGRLSGDAEVMSPRQVKELIRRLFWGMNDESGNLIWGAPETVAAVLLQHRELITKFAPILASHLEIDPFPKGVHEAIARLSEISPETFTYLAPKLSESLKSTDPFLRAYAGRALLLMGLLEERDRERLLEDDASFEFYHSESGEFRRITVGAAVRNGME